MPSTFASIICLTIQADMPNDLDTPLLRICLFDDAGHQTYWSVNGIVRHTQDVIRLYFQLLFSVLHTLMTNNDGIFECFLRRFLIAAGEKDIASNLFISIHMKTEDLLQCKPQRSGSPMTPCFMMSVRRPEPTLRLLDGVWAGLCEWDDFMKRSSASVCHHTKSNKEFHTSKRKEILPLRK